MAIKMELTKTYDILIVSTYATKNLIDISYHNNL